MPRGGRYRHVRIVMWAQSDWRSLSPEARLVYVALSTGSLSNMAGIFLLPDVAPIVMDTGLPRARVEAALGELESRPSAKRSFIVRDEMVIWVRDQLGSDPAREGDPDLRNINHRKGVETLLGNLPRQSSVVRKFRSYYHLAPQAPPQAPRQAPGEGAPQSRIPDTGAGNRKQETGTGEGEHERERQPPPARSDGASASASSNGNKGHDASKSELDLHEARMIKAGASGFERRGVHPPRPEIQAQYQRLVVEDWRPSSNGDST